MRRSVSTAALAATLMLTSASAYATHEGAATPCCEASGGFACDEANSAEDVDGEHSGCVEVEAAGACSGGSLDPSVGGPAGCVCIAGSCNADGVAASAEDCRAAAVAACCAAASCHPAP